MLRIALLCSACLAVFASGRACADDVVIDNVEVGLRGAYRIGEWTPLTIRIDSAAEIPRDVIVETVTLDADGTAARRLSKPVAVEGDSPNVIRTIFQSGRANSPLTIRLRDGDRKLLAERRLLPGSPAFQAALPRGEFLAVIAGAFEGSSEAGSPPVPVPESMRAVSLDEPLPRDPSAYCAASVLIVRGNIAPSQEQAEAIRQWVAAGGHLAVVLGRDTPSFRQGPLADWMPIDVGEMVQLRDVSALSNFPRRARVQIASLGNGQRAFPPGSETPLYAGSDYGFGRVTVFAMDFDRPPFSTWSGLPELIGEAIVEEEPPSLESRRLTAPGVTDLSTQLMRSEQSFAGVERRSVGSALLLLLLIAAVVGPLDYLIVHHVLRRPALTWLTLPMLVLVSGWWLHRSAVAANGTSSRYNEFHLVDVDVATGTIRGRSAVSLYAADSARVALEVASPSKSDWQISDVGSSPRLGWLSPPETNLGGSYRDASGGLFQPEYEVLSSDTSSKVQRLPLLVWSGRQFLASWQGESSRALVEGDVVTTGIGRAEGTLIHRLAGPLTNVMIAVGDRISVAEPGFEWYPNEPIALESSTFRQRDLDAFLTGKTTRQVDRGPGEAGEDFIVNESLYDPASTNLADVVTMLTFHEAAGGRGYTGLTNQMFASDDLSRHLETGHAVVLAQIDVPATTVSVTTDSDATFGPARRTTFVRFVIPTTRAKSTAPAALIPLAPTDGSSSPSQDERPPRS